MIMHYVSEGLFYCNLLMNIRWLG